MSNDHSIPGYCPMGCGQTLFAGSGGYITCSWINCPRPTAIADLLEDRETEHLATFDADGFTIRHPLRERLDEQLIDCSLHNFCRQLPGPPPQLGTYRVRARGQQWHFGERVVDP